MENYSLVKIIGEGSFGRALLVQCKNSEQKCVLKEIQLPLNSKSENTRREAVLLSKMSHANIVAFRESFEGIAHKSNQNPLGRIFNYYYKFFLTNVYFSVFKILKWFAQMCAGAKHIHDKRVLHRDLKSKNIFLTENGTIKLGDFGSACVLNNSKAFAQTYVGTPYYVAPEIWDNQPYNNKSDVWSLGCVLYELCTLQHPFQASSWKRLILKVCRGSYPPLPRHLPYEVHYLLKHMFKTNPKDRPSLHTILTSHRVSKLLHCVLFPSRIFIISLSKSPMLEMLCSTLSCHEEVVFKLTDTSYLCSVETQEWSHSESHELPQRKQWTPSDTVVQRLANASLMSANTLSSGRAEEEPEEPKEQPENRQRRRWSREPAQRLLSVLEKAPLHRAFSTFIIHTAGPPPDQQGDNIDGVMQEEIDEERLQPRSDDDDTSVLHRTPNHF
uniref:Protein kinase domain-containing protein n=1 Tax=Periophthalmus magnuspinnatus TaxID=409849 RepID=A0A3B3ZHY1_9GOBI